MRYCYDVKDVRFVLKSLLEINKVNEMQLDVPFIYVTQIGAKKFVAIKRNSNLGRVRFYDESNKPTELSHLLEKTLVNQFNKWQEHYEAYCEHKSLNEFLHNKEEFGKQNFDVVMSMLNKNSWLVKKFNDYNISTFESLAPNKEVTLKTIEQLFDYIKDCYKLFVTPDSELSNTDQASKLYFTTGEVIYKKLANVYEDSEYFKINYPLINSSYEEEFVNILYLLEKRGHSKVAVNFNSSWDGICVAQLLKRGYNYSHLECKKGTSLVVFNIPC